MKKNIVIAVGAALVAGAAFYGGMLYGKGNQPARDRSGSGPAGQFAGRAGAGAGSGLRGGGFVAGEVLSKDDSGITIKMSDGNTKIVLVGGSTHVFKSAEGSSDDLVIGASVMVSGKANGDGSITAESVQIRPDDAAFPLRGR